MRRERKGATVRQRKRIKISKERLWVEEGRERKGRESIMGRGKKGENRSVRVRKKGAKRGYDRLIRRGGRNGEGKEEEGRGKVRE